MRFINIILVLFLSTQLQAQVHTYVFPDLIGNDLQNEIVNAYKPTTVLEYGPARDLMYGTIYNENDSVTCIYTGHQLYLPQGVDPSSYLYSNGSSDGINCEHAYPRSKGAAEENGNPFSDMHHLFPARTAVNAARSNYAFGEIIDNQTTEWYYLNQTQTSIPQTNIDAYSEGTAGRFEPRESSKGNIARAVFYFYTMYKGEALSADPNYFESQRATLCDWHIQDPIDSLEWERTQMIATYQNGLPNPYVLDSTLVLRSFCGAPVATQELLQPEILVYPNPVIDVVSVDASGKSSLQVTDVLGRVLKEQQFFDETEVDLSKMNPGIYFMIVNEKTFKLVKR